ncbi:MAG: caspase family protein [Candidatus Methanofastidiosia archaeon]|jgi:hypothetical protein
MNRKALLVGIDDYEPVGAGGPDLRGCVNDIRDVAHTFHALGIVDAKPTTMHILTNARASKANILKEFKWLIKGAQEGDVLVFHYSGHGSWMVDVFGDEIDWKDETICPHDFKTAGMIKDDELRNLISGLKENVTLDVVLDCCHSGTGTRELNALAAVPEEQRVTYRYIEPPLDYRLFFDVDPTIQPRKILKPSGGTREAVVVPGLNHVVWTGCCDYQTSAEARVNGEYRGIFTYCFCKVLRRAGIEITRSKLDSLVSTYIKDKGYSQIPQLEGTGMSMSEKVFT